MSERDGLLVLDIGNTNTVLGLYRGEELIDHWRIATNADSTTDETGVLFLGLFAARGIDARSVGAAIVSCVVPPMVHAVERACQRYFDVTARFVGSDLSSGMPIVYDNPQEVGADRIVNAVAAYAAHQRACIIVDFGTATTFDVVGPEGSYRGGVIAPGLGISLDALQSRAAKLPRVKIQRPSGVIGTNTIASMQAGIVYGYVGLVDGITERIIEELAAEGVDEFDVIATGGLAGLIASYSRYLDVVEPFLTLEGLRLIHCRNPDLTAEAPGSPP